MAYYSEPFADLTDEGYRQLVNPGFAKSKPPPGLFNYGGVKQLADMTPEAAAKLMGGAPQGQSLEQFMAQGKPPAGLPPLTPEGQAQLFGQGARGQTMEEFFSRAGKAAGLPYGATPGQLTGPEFGQSLSLGALATRPGDINLADVSRFIQYGGSGPNPALGAEERAKALGAFLGLGQGSQGLMGESRQMYGLLGDMALRQGHLALEGQRLSHQMATDAPLSKLITSMAAQPDRYGEGDIMRAANLYQRVAPQYRTGQPATPVGVPGIPNIVIPGMPPAAAVPGGAAAGSVTPGGAVPGGVPGSSAVPPVASSSAPYENLDYTIRDMADRVSKDKGLGAKDFLLKAYNQNPQYFEQHLDAILGLARKNYGDRSLEDFVNRQGMEFLGDMATSALGFRHSPEAELASMIRNKQGRPEPTSRLKGFMNRIGAVGSGGLNETLRREAEAMMRQAGAR